jgi:sugar phosphate isomerase/epimerase
MRPALSAALPAFSLAHLTLLSTAPAALIDIAAAAGYQHVGLRLLPSAAGGVAWPLMDDPAALREVQARVRDTGVTVFDLEIVRLGADFNASAYLRFFETGAALGAQAVLVGADDTEPARCAASYAALCEAAAPFGLRPNIEFMPWTAVKNLRDAARLIRDAGTPANSGLLIDALHFARSDSHVAEVAEVPRGWLHYAQVCDAPAAIPTTVEGLIHTAREERQLPGEGGIALTPLLVALPADLPLSVEIPHPARAAAMGEAEWAREALRTSQRAAQIARDAGAAGLRSSR